MADPEYDLTLPQAMAERGELLEDLITMAAESEHARSLAVRLEQENAERLRLLADLATEAADLDAWPSNRLARALKAAQDHLAAVTT